jgi:hypothetical protein
MGVRLKVSGTVFPLNIVFSLGNGSRYPLFFPLPDRYSWHNCHFYTTCYNKPLSVSQYIRVLKDLKKIEDFRMKPPLTVEHLLDEANRFAQEESNHPEPSLYGVTDGKAVGTYFEKKFRAHLLKKFTAAEANSAKGIDLPDLGVDVKVTSIKQPQSSCPFTSARQKIFGLGYSVLVFVYQKTDDPKTSTGRLEILHVIFIEKHRTADFQTTAALRQILCNAANEDDLLAFMQDRNLPVDDIQALKIAKELLKKKPEQGYLTISNALQWRLQYNRVIQRAGEVEGVRRIR